MSIIIEVPFAAPGKARARSSGNGRFYTPEKTVRAEKFIQECARTAMCGRQIITGPIEVWIDAIYLPPKSWSLKRQTEVIEEGQYKLTKPDIDNIQKLVLDALNPSDTFGGVWSDDARVVQVHASKFYGPEDLLKIEIDEAGD